MLEHRQLRRLLLDARILRARGLSGHTSPHFTLRTSPATSRTPRCSDIVSYAGTPRCLDVASYAGNSSVLRHRQLRLGLLGARTSPATPRAPLVVGSCYVSSVCYQAAPCYLDQGADLGQHVWGLDTRMLDDVGKLSDFFFFDPTIRFILHLPAGSGTKWAHFTLQ